MAGFKDLSAMNKGGNKTEAEEPGHRSGEHRSGELGHGLKPPYDSDAERGLRPKTNMRN